MYRRSGLRVRPLLLRRFQPQQEHQSLAKPHGRKQQQQAVKQGHSVLQQQVQLPQDSEHPPNDDEHVNVREQPTSPAHPQLDTALLEPEDDQQDNSLAAGVEALQTSDVTAHGDKAEAQAPECKGKAASKAHKTKRTKKDYAAWAGATSETRALATAHSEAFTSAECAGRPQPPTRTSKQGGGCL